ncbi:MAG: hypothetical protein RLZZ171_2848 [Cyanobacteriota bacterium]|jgi:hypothetical protein
MLSTNIAQTIDQVQSQTVYEYSFSLINTTDNDTQDNLTAAFTFIPTLIDWQEWLSGWISCGYSLSSSPQLIRTI